MTTLLQLGVSPVRGKTKAIRNTTLCKLHTVSKGFWADGGWELTETCFERLLTSLRERLFYKNLESNDITLKKANLNLFGFPTLEGHSTVM